LEFKPYYYQSFCIKRIINNPVVGLLLDMGMGKTVITLTAVNELMHNYFAARRVLVIAPLAPARDTWAREAEKWDHLNHLRLSVVLGSKLSREAALQNPADIYVINRENVPWLVGRYGRYGKDWPFDTVIIDELSSFKSASAVRFRALKRVRGFINRIVGLTGTPAPNGLLDLWPQMFLLDGGAALGRTFSGYREQFFLPDKRGPQVVYTWKLRPGSEDEIYQRISGLCVSMKSADYLRLPTRLDIRHDVKMSAGPMAVYQLLERKSSLCFEDGSSIDGTTAAVLANKLLQAASGAAYDDTGAMKILHDEKLIALSDLIESANGQPVIVFYTYVHEKTRIKALYPDAVDIKSKNAVERWNKGDIQLLLAHPASAGHGLNLQFGGHIAIWFGLTYSLELYQQANKRLHRIGQRNTVLIHHLIMTDTIEESIFEYVLMTKEARQNALLDALKARADALAGLADTPGCFSHMTSISV
jgi:SNF2 family DNA or RNA helicase